MSCLDQPALDPRRHGSWRLGSAEIDRQGPQTRRGRNVIRMNANQHESDGATRVACILGVPLAENVVRQWPQMGEIVRSSRLVVQVEGNFPSSRSRSAGAFAVVDVAEALERVEALGGS